MPKAPSDGGFGSLLPSHPRQTQGGKCSVGIILRSMGENDAESLRSALADVESYSSASLARALCEYGYKISHSSVQRHRSKGCHCGE